MEKRSPQLTWLSVWLTLALIASVKAQNCQLTNVPGATITGNTIGVFLDENDNIPSLVSAAYRAQLPIGGNIGQAGISLSLTQDPQAANVPANLQNPNVYFDLVADNNGQGIYIRLISPLDRDGNQDQNIDPLPAVNFQIQCTTGGSTVTYPLTVNLNDVNDNQPIFRNLDTAITFGELQRNPVFTCTATDRDSTNNGFGLINFSIVSGQTVGNEDFSIDQQTGIVQPIQRLDFETRSFYSLGIEARDKDLNNPRSMIGFLNISLIDENDEPPAFISSGCTTTVRSFCIRPTYTATIVSGSTNPNVNVQPNAIRARDRDTLLAPITFSIYSSSPAGFVDRFSLSQAQLSFNGEYTVSVTQNSAINRNDLINTQGQITLLIQAAEDSVQGYRAYAVLVITVLPGSTNAPTLTIVTGDRIGIISEAAQGGTLVRTSSASTRFLQLQINDADYYSNEDLPTNYFFTTSIPELFEVTNDNFIALRTASLDYETTPDPFVLVVTVQERNTQLTGTISVTINILDVNDNNPVFPASVYTSVFQEGTYNVGFNSPPPVAVATVQATDADSNQAFRNLQYSISAVTNNGIGLFNINSVTGAITGSGTFVPGNYTITVAVTDGQAVTQTAVLVTVTRVTGVTAPQFSAGMFNIVVSEGVLQGASVFTMMAVDPDASDVLTYSMQQTTPTTTSNQNDFDFVISTSGLVSVRSTGTNVQRILDREIIDNYVYLVNVRDLTFNTATATLSIQISDINDHNPVFLQDQYNFQVDENTFPTTVGTVTATDADQPNTVNSQVFYRIQNQFGFQNRFTINNAGEISLNWALDYEIQSQYLVVIEAVDLSVNPRTGTVTATINVRDLQDNIPLFVDNFVSVTINENTSPGTTVATLSAIDQDSIQTITFKLSGMDSGDFTLQSAGGTAYLVVGTNGVDFERRTSYTLTMTTVEALNTNSQDPDARVTIQISIIDLNEFAPDLQVSASSISVTETAKVGQVLLTAAATDQDNPSNNLDEGITYIISSFQPSSGQDHFVIGSLDGNVYLVRSFIGVPNRPNSYTITIEANDNDLPSPLTNSRTVTISVMGNLGPPFFTNSGFYSQTIPETTAVGDSVLTVDAQDQDAANEQIVYSIVFDTIEAHYFQINSASGVLTVVSSLSADPTGRLQYGIRILATDTVGLSATATAQITVNRNLNDPEFTGSTSYSATVFENQTLCSSVLILQANDIDINAPHNMLSFLVTGGRIDGSNAGFNAANFFTVDCCGVLSICNSLVGTSGETLTFNVSLSDNGQPSSRQAANQADVTITVRRNTAAPIYFATTYFSFTIIISFIFCF